MVMQVARVVLVDAPLQKSVAEHVTQMQIGLAHVLGGRGEAEKVTPPGTTYTPTVGHATALAECARMLGDELVADVDFVLGLVVDVLHVCKIAYLFAKSSVFKDNFFLNLSNSKWTLCRLNKQLRILN